MSQQEMFADTRSATGLPESGSGATLPGSLDGLTVGPCGAEAVPALPSRRQAKAAGLMMLVTSGLIGDDSSASASLQSCLESRLMMRLDTAGSTLFKLTWRGRRTPLGRRYLERAASVRRTSVKGFTSWPTPQARDSFPANMSGSTLTQQSSLARWCSPSARDWKDTEGMALSGTNPDGSERIRLDQLPRQATLAAFGLMPSGFPAGTPSYPEQSTGGQLNPEHSRWLMGLPPVFSRCVVLAMQSSRKSPRSGSKRISNLKEVECET